MTERKALFRRVFDALIAHRTLEAERYIAAYLKTRPAAGDRHES